MRKRVYAQYPHPELNRLPCRLARSLGPALGHPMPDVLLAFGASHTKATNACRPRVSSADLWAGLATHRRPACNPPSRPSASACLEDLRQQNALASPPSASTTLRNSRLMRGGPCEGSGHRDVREPHQDLEPLHYQCGLLCAPHAACWQELEEQEYAFDGQCLEKRTPPRTPWPPHGNIHVVAQVFHPTTFQYVQVSTRFAPATAAQIPPGMRTKAAARSVPFSP